MTPASKVLSLLVFLFFGHSIYSQDIQLVPQTAHVNGIKTAALSPDGNFFVTAGFDNIIKVWDYKSGKLIQNKQTEGAVVNSILFLNNSDFITGDSKGYVAFNNLTSKTPLLKRKISSRQINSISYDKVGNKFWCAGYGGLLVALDADSLTTIFEMKNFQVEINAASFLPKKEVLLLGATSGKLFIFDTKLKSLTDSSEIFSTDISGVSGFNDDTEIVATSFGGEVKFFNFDRQTGLKQSKVISTKPVSMITSLSISPSGNNLAATTFDNDIYLIDTKTKSSKSVIHAHEYTISGFGFWDDNNGFSYSFGNRTLIWDLTNFTSPVREISGLAGDIIHFGIGGGILVFSTSEGSVYSVDVSKSFSATKIFQSFNSITALKIDPVLKYVAFGEEDGTVTLMNAITGDQIFQSRLHTKAVLSIEINSDYLITSSADKTVRIVPSNNLNSTPVSPTKLTNRFTSIGYSKKLQLIALGSEEGLIYFVEPVTGRKESTLAGHSAPVNSLEFSDDGGFLLSTSVDKTIRVWNNNDLFNFKTWHNNAGIAFDALFLSNDVILSTGDGGRVMLHEFKNDSTSFFQEGTQAFFNLERPNDNSVSALSADGLVYIWDRISHKITYLIYSHNEHISIMDFGNGVVYSSTEKNDIFLPAGYNSFKHFEIKPLNSFKFKF